MKNRKVNLLEKVLRRWRKKIKYANCLTHRTWLERQVQEEQLKQHYRRNVTVMKEDPNWYSKYID